MESQFTRVFDILSYQEARFPQLGAVNTFSDGKWNPDSISQIIDKVNTVSCWLMSKGFKKGDKLAIIPHHGNLNWLVIDFACQQLGIIIIPVHPTYPVEALEAILEETSPVLIIVADGKLEEHLNNLLKDTSILFTLENGLKNSFSKVLDYKKTQIEEEERKLIKKSIKDDDILTIMYTSGTSGIPKGVVLTHKNMVSNILFTLAAFPLESSKKVMSYLPFSHILERSACYAYIACGASIHFVRSKDTFLEDFQSAKPYFSTSVPRVLEKMYARLQEQALAENKVKRAIVNWALKTAKEYNKEDKKRISLTFKLFFARLLVLNKWKNQLGGKLACLVVGAAALRPEIARMFSAANIRIREGYGMTEASPLISLNRFSPGLNRFGTVGIPIPSMDLIIDKENENGEGEILIKGPNVTQGYYKRPKINKEAFTKDGWFKTGDVGKLLDGNFLQITDRKQDIFKTSSGKFIAPQTLENKLNSSHFIYQSVILGLSRPYVIAILILDFSFLEEWCLRNEIHWTSPTYMIHNIKVREKIDQEIQSINQDLVHFKKIRDYILGTEEWTIENQLLTGTLKPLRKKIIKQFDQDIDKVYNKKKG